MPGGLALGAAYSVQPPLESKTRQERSSAFLGPALADYAEIPSLLASCRVEEVMHAKPLVRTLPCADMNACMHACAHAHMCMHTGTQVCEHRSACVRERARARARTHARTHARAARTHARTHTRTCCTLSHEQVHAHKCIHAHMQMHTCAHANAYMHTCKCIHARRQAHASYTSACMPTRQRMRACMQLQDTRAHTHAC